MEISRVRIENFRSLRELELEFGKNTILIGPNNAGKTAVLDALRIALTRRWGQSGTGFTEYDIHLRDDTQDAKTAPPASIEITVEEREKGEWSEEIQQDLDNIVQVDPHSGRSFVVLRATWGWNATTEAFEPTWHFLNAARKPLGGASARRTNLEKFWRYLPIFYLGALRDADTEFSPRSQLWGRLLKAVQIPAPLETRVQRVLGLVNKKLLGADPKLERISATLSGATRVAARGGDGGADLRLLPQKSWDILSKAELILRNEATWPWLPLERHGQGVQSLSVVFLFQAFVEHVLADAFEPQSSPILALEEPETHLHPQAARALWSHVSALPGQKIVTTHSPYFVQHVPFRDIRLLRLTPRGTEARSLPSSYSAIVPNVEGLEEAVKAIGGLVEYERPARRMTVNGTLTDDAYRRLLTCFGGKPELQEGQAALVDLKRRSASYVSDADLDALQLYARRIRGEIFFARKWLLVEGQAEYLILHALAEALDYRFDDFGVALIDAANNGNPETFAVIARGFGIPWCAIFDGDGAGRGYVTRIKARDFDGAWVDSVCALHAAGTLEQQLIADGLTDDLREILKGLGKAEAETCDEQRLLKLMANCKTDYAAELVSRLRAGKIGIQNLPTAFRNAIQVLRAMG